MVTYRMNACVSLAAAAGGCFFSISAWGAADPPAYMQLGSIGGSINTSLAMGVSGDGLTVVGSSHSAASGPSNSEAFRWTAATGMVGLGDLPTSPYWSSAVGVSADGSIIAGYGNYHPFGPLTAEACRWVNGVLNGLGTPRGMDQSSGRGISGDGQVIVVQAYSDSMTPPPRAYAWTVKDGYIDLGTLPDGDRASVAGVSFDGSVIVGGGPTSNSLYEAFRWTAKEGMVAIGTLGGPGLFQGDAIGVSADGQVIFGEAVAPSGVTSFRWTEAEGMVGLGELPSGPPASAALAGNGDGSVIVGRAYVVPQTSTSLSVAYIWDANHGMRDLKQVLLDLGVTIPANWTLWEARGISADGRTIVGRAINGQGGSQAFLARLNRAGDVNADGFVNIDDLLGVISAWGPCPGTCLADTAPPIAGNGVVDIDDLLMVINHWDS